MTSAGSRPVARRSLAATTCDALILRQAHQVTAIPMKGRATTMNAVAAVPVTGKKARIRTPNERLLMTKARRKVLTTLIVLGGEVRLDMEVF